MHIEETFHLESLGAGNIGSLKFFFSWKHWVVENIGRLEMLGGQNYWKPWVFGNIWWLETTCSWKHLVVRIIGCFGKIVFLFMLVDTFGILVAY